MENEQNTNTSENTLNLKNRASEAVKNKAVSKGGNMMIKAGAGLSETGAGAVVGVPLMAAGGIVRGVQKLRSSSTATGEEVEKKINGITTILMLLTAGLVDLIQALVDLLHLIPVVGNIIAAVVTAGITICALIGFFIWFKIHDASFVPPKRAWAILALFGLEFIPIANALPGWTGAIILAIWTSNKESVDETQKIAGEVQQSLAERQRLQPRAPQTVHKPHVRIPR